MFLILGIILSALAAGFFAASQTALLSLSQPQVRSWKNSPDARRRAVAQLVLKPRELLVMLYILDIIASLLVQNFASNYFGEEASWWLKVGLPLFIVVTVGDVIPKSLGFAHNVAISTHVATLYVFIAKIMAPLRFVITLITSYVSRCLFFFMKRPKEITSQELHELFRHPKVTEVLSREECGLVEGFLTLQEASVKELMRPRDEVMSYDIGQPIERLMQLIVDEGRSKVPVISGSLDNLLGVISSRSFFLHRDAITKGEDLKPLLSTCFFVPENTRARLLLRQMPARSETLAIVVDEYGTVAGTIAWEDLIEEVVGSKAEDPGKKLRYTRAGDDTVVASGKLELSEFSDLFGVHLKSQANMTTLGGWLTEKMGDIPKVGDQMIDNGFLFQILAADQKRIRRVWIKRLEKEQP